MLRRETIRVCSICGKSEGPHWKRHWQRRHPGNQIKELIPGNEPQEPYDENWLFLINDIEIRKIFDTSTKTQQSNKVTQREATKSIDQDTIKMFHSQLVDFEPSFVEIDAESDGEQYNTRQKQPIVDDNDFSSVPTQQLFKIAKTIMNTLKDRLIAKHIALRHRQDQAVSERQVSTQPVFRHIFKTNGDCHLSMSRIINEPHVSHSNPSWVASSVQFAFNIQTIPINQWKVDYLFQELQRVDTYIKQVENFIGNLDEISFPTLMTINESNVEMKIVEKSLSLRSKQLLKRGRWAPKPYIPPLLETIQNNLPDDPAKYFPLLYGPMNALGEYKPEGPQEINTEFIDCGDDLTYGVIAIDGLRYLISFVKKMIKKIILIDLKDGFVEILEDWRAFLNRKLQYFINMLLFSEIGTCKQKVTVNFIGCCIEPREFTVNVKPKEYRESRNNSSYHLRQLLDITKEIAEAVVAIKDFTVAFNEIKVQDRDFDLLLPIVKKVIDSIQNLKNGKDIDHSQRLKILSEVVKEEKERVEDPNLIDNLKEETSNSKFYSTVDMRALAKWKLMKVEFKNGSKIIDDQDEPEYN